MKPIIKTVFFILVLLTAYIIWADFIKEGSPYSKEHIPLMSEFADKVVYTTDLSEDTTPLKTDCKERNGKFNECGTICSSKTEICPTVCAFTCEIRTAEKESENILAYKSYYYGFILNYPKGMKVKDSSMKKEVVFSLYGPSQKESEFLNDGIRLNIRSIAYDSGDSLEDAAHKELLKYQQIGQIIEPIRSVKFSGLDGVMFKAKKEQIVTDYFFPKEPKRYFLVSYIVEDPQNLGYQKIADFMLDSFKPTSESK